MQDIDFKAKARPSQDTKLDTSPLREKTGVFHDFSKLHDFHNPINFENVVHEARETIGFFSKPTSFFSILLGVSICTFSIGAILGIFIGKAKVIEDGLISHPDNDRPEYNNVHLKNKASNTLVNSRLTLKDSSPRPIINKQDEVDSVENNNFSNVPTLQKSKEMIEGTFIIKLGVYPSYKAKELSDFINSKEEFKSLKVYSCKNIKKNTLTDQIAFRVNVPQDPSEENLLLGCFLEKNIATRVLNKILSKKIDEKQDPKLYEIND